MSMYVLLDPGCSFPTHEGLNIIVPFINPLGAQRVKSRFGCIESIKL